MDHLKQNSNVVHPDDLISKKLTKISNFNNRLALKITNAVGSMWSAYLFACLSFMSLPAIMVLINPNLKNAFPHWIVAASLITLIAWISQNFLQLVLLPVIMVGQNVIQDKQSAKAETDHKTLTYLANIQEEQIVLIKKQSETLDYIKTKLG